MLVGRRLTCRAYVLHGTKSQKHCKRLFVVFLALWPLFEKSWNFPKNLRELIIVRVTYEGQ